MKTLALLLLAATALSATADDLPPLNAVPTQERFPGKFVWGDLLTDDIQGAQAFYTGLFGWTAVTIQRTTASGAHPYVVMSIDGRPIAGIWKRPAALRDEAHGRWIGYVSVPDVDKALAAAQSGGGRILSKAKNLPKRGDQGILADPSGAYLGVMNSSSGDPGEYLPDPGDWAWAELFTKDPTAASVFYRFVVGYGVVPDDRSDTPGKLLLTSGGYSRASIAPLPPRPKARTTWLLLVRVADVKEAAARAVKLGGRVLVAPSDSPSEYWRSVVADPSGAFIGLVQLDETQADGGASK